MQAVLHHQYLAHVDGSHLHRNSGSLAQPAVSVLVVQAFRPLVVEVE